MSNVGAPFMISESSNSGKDEYMVSAVGVFWMEVMVPRMQ